MKHRVSRYVMPLLALVLTAGQASTVLAQLPVVATGTVDWVDSKAGLVVIDDRQYVLGTDVGAAATSLRHGTQVTFRYVENGQQRVITGFDTGPRRR